MRKSFKYRIYANKETTNKAETWILLCRQLYNDCLNERIVAYKDREETISLYTQINKLPELKKAFPEFKQVGSQVLQDVIERLHKAYQAFFRRVKEGNIAGFPRFKGQDRYNSFTLKQAGWKLNGKQLTIANIGTFKVKLSRPILGTIKTVIISKTSSNKWFVSFSCNDVPLTILPATGNMVGLDVGCESFLTDSDGNKIANPRHLKKSQSLLAARQQSLSHKVKWSNRRRKAKVLVAKVHEKITNQRQDFHYKTANQLIKNNDTICIEGMKAFTSFTALTKSMRDVAWFQFFNILLHKAEEAGRVIIKVPAKNTSQMCSRCGQLVKKDLSVRIHACTCGLTIDRDWNAAINILRLGQSLQG